MKRKLKLITMLGILAIGILLLTSAKSQAVLQSNPNTNYKTTKPLVYTSSTGGTEGWLTAIRKTETNGSMGLAVGSINESTLAGPTNNNIDVHCIKTTEYGAMAILSASAYGNPSNEKAITTTTGNNTGIIVNTNNWEWTASITGGKSYLCHSESVQDKYILEYIRDPAGYNKPGDALTDCKQWHSASSAVWLDSGDAFVRGNGGIFSYSRFCNYYNGDDVHKGRVYHFARSTIVCGEGL